MKQPIDKVSMAVVAKAITKDSKPVINKLRKLEIIDEASYDLAGQKLKELKEWERLAIEKEKSVTDLLDKLRDEIKGLFSPFRDTVKTLIAQKKEEMLLFVQSKKEKQKKLDEKFEKGKIGTRAYVTGTNRNAVNPTTSGLRKVWTPIPVDISKTPREYLVPDLTKIREALKAGKKVAGWDYQQVDNITL